MRRSERGYALAALIAGITIMLVGLGVAVPTWRYIMKNDREEELLFRGWQIADAVGRYQKKNGNALPPNLDVLVKGRYLRKAWKEPFAKNGEWRFVRQGEAVGPVRAPGSPTTPTTTLGPGAPAGPTIGGFLGVASTSNERSLRLYNGREHYNEWIFAVGQPRIVGAQAQLPGVPPGTVPGGAPDGRPPTLPGDNEPGAPGTPEAPELP